jgi:acyl-CoA synthetase (AMP-forming)/AMP-acid ligase II
MVNGQQTAVDDKPAIGFAGMWADSGPHKTRSYVSEESSAEMPFGVMLARGTTDKDKGALLPHTSAAAMAAAFVGVLMHAHEYAETFELGDTGLKPKMTLKVATHGTVLVLPEEAVEPGDPVRVRVVTAGEEQAGAFLTTDDDSADCVDVSAFCRWLSSGDENTPAELEINMTLASQGVADAL